MENYVGLKRSRTYQITEVEKITGINEEGYIVIEIQKIDSRNKSTSRSIRMVTQEGDNVKVIEAKPSSMLPLEENLDGGWDNIWPDDLSNPKNEKKIYYVIP